MSEDPDDSIYGALFWAIVVTLISGGVYLATDDPQAAVTLMFFGILGGLSALVLKSEWLILIGIILEVLGMLAPKAWVFR